MRIIILLISFLYMIGQDKTSCLYINSINDHNGYRLDQLNFDKSQYYLIINIKSATIAKNKKNSVLNYLDQTDQKNLSFNLKNQIKLSNKNIPCDCQDIESFNFGVNSSFKVYLENENGSFVYDAIQLIVEE